MLRYTGVPRLENAIGVDVEVLVRTKLDFDVAYIENLCIRGKQLSGALIPEHRVILVEAFDIGSVAVLRSLMNAPILSSISETPVLRRCLSRMATLSSALPMTLELLRIRPGKSDGKFSQTSSPRRC